MGRKFWGGALPLLLVAVAACSPMGARSGDTRLPEVPAPPSTASAPSTTPTSAPPTTRPTVPDELAKSPVRRTLTSSGLTVKVEYQTGTPSRRWTPAGSKPLRVSVTVRNGSSPQRKVYVTRATMRFTVGDGTEEAAGPDPLVDAANITPGYLATAPYSYVQSFAIPALDESATELTVDLKLEMVSLVDVKAKDYTKQTVTDTVHAALRG